ncbi:methyl-accepting chemotaxis protein [Priestia taiwanensis]|uniref:Methyl-accepting chemotaxis protein n=1 Tax=Priestia taiwanensis TaxID=1347902 RepID=A0A917AXZ0_9BACI|nr:methyl-accepting chemotaxis protein [Priestia taiwanensis]MBM7364989.1 methyl-accepting chemotaxis protein [Priestia taiwanensis]GGE81962.1 methyl-accepting chemotaxis protein [Priestia taiwanensis]
MRNISLRWKIVLFITTLATITYSISAIFIFIGYDYIDFMVSFSQGSYTTIIFILGIIWSGILGFLASGYITSSLKKLESAASKVAEGNLRVEVAIPRSNDEIQLLSIGFSKMVHQLRTVIYKLEQTIILTNDKVKGMSHEAGFASKQAENIAYAMQEIAGGAESSALSIQSTTERMDEVLSYSQKMQQEAVHSQNLSSKMLENLEESTTSIHHLLKGIEQLVENNNYCLQAVGSLEKKAKEIQHIVNLVGDIANQTNLLALNASIEAARAGEHGRGFSVVAEEVRGLADQSAQAVQSIGELVRNIQDDIDKTVANIAEQSKVVTNEQEVGIQTFKVVDDMTLSVKQVAESVEGITLLAKKQSDSIEQTFVQVQEVSAVSEETSASSQEIMNATKEQAKAIEAVEELAKELLEETEELTKVINTFQQ